MSNRIGKLDYLVYSINTNIPYLEKKSKKYITVYGPDFSLERKLYAIIKKYCTGKSIDFFAIGDGKLYQYLNSRMHNILKGYDINPKNIEYAKKNFDNRNVYLSNDFLSIEPSSDTLICYNIFNSISVDERKNYCKEFCRKYKYIIFIGEVVTSDRKALGPEPIGSYGCRQFLTKNMFSNLSDIISTDEINIGDNNYCYIRNQ